MTSKRLGRGLAELIDATAQPTANFVLLRTEQIRAGRFQPRTSIQPETLEELKASIKKSGIIEPVLVRPVAHGTYELIAGERRLKAAQAIGIKEIPAIIRTLSDKEALEVSLVENIQRENLNPIEEANGYARLREEFGYTQEEIASAVGKDRATIANLLRLLTLSEEIRRGIEHGAIAMGHAKVLLAVEDRGKQAALFRQAAEEGISVRQMEALIGAWAPAKKRRAKRIEPHLQSLEDELRRVLGTKVSVMPRKKGGRLVIEYFSQEDLTRILQVLGLSGE